jgi:hypothetical protein
MRVTILEGLQRMCSVNISMNRSGDISVNPSRRVSPNPCPRMARNGSRETCLILMTASRSIFWPGFSPMHFTQAQTSSPGFKFFQPSRRVTNFVRFLTCSVVKEKLMFLIA